MQKIEFKKGDVILREGETGNRLIVMRTGQVDVFKGDLLIASLSEPGSIFGEMSVLLREPHTASVIAASDVTAIEVPDAIDFLKTKPDVCFKVSELLARRLSDVTEQLVEMRKQAGHSDKSDQLGDAVKTVLKPGPVDLESDYEFYEVEVLQPGSDDYPAELKS